MKTITQTLIEASKKLVFKKDTTFVKFLNYYCGQNMDQKTWVSKIKNLNNEYDLETSLGTTLADLTKAIKENKKCTVEWYDGDMAEFELNVISPSIKFSYFADSMLGPNDKEAKEL